MVTLKDIAKEAGVSVNTVSCALRDSPRISKKVKQRVKEIADRMGYTPNYIARALRIKKSKVIGVIVSDISNPVFGKMVKGVESAAKQKNYSLIICNTEEEHDMEVDAVTTMISKGVDGVVITPTQHDISSLELLKKMNIPFILMGRRFKNYSTNYVVSDDFRGGYISGEYFIKKGHRKLIFINGTKHISSSQEREEGFIKALAKFNLLPQKIFYIMPDIHQGYHLAKKILDTTMDFTGIFCFDDYTAFGVIKAIREKGLRIPQDIAIIGYDNTEFAEMLDIGLTSVDFNEYRIGELVAEHIMDIIENSKASDDNNEVIHRQVILEPSLVVRGSV